MTITLDIRAVLASKRNSSRGFGLAVHGLLLLDESSCSLFPLETAADNKDECVRIDDPVAIQQIRDRLGASASYWGEALVVGLFEREPKECVLRQVTELWLYEFEPQLRIRVRSEDVGRP